MGNNTAGLSYFFDNINNQQLGEVMTNRIILKTTVG